MLHLERETTVRVEASIWREDVGGRAKAASLPANTAPCPPLASTLSSRVAAGGRWCTGVEACADDVAVAPRLADLSASWRLCVRRCLGDSSHSPLVVVCHHAWGYIWGPARQKNLKARRGDAGPLSRSWSDVFFGNTLGLHRELLVLAQRERCIRAFWLCACGRKCCVAGSACPRTWDPRCRLRCSEHAWP